jgi:hypothetical protein
MDGRKRNEEISRSHEIISYRTLSVSTKVCCLISEPSNLGNAASNPCENKISES